MYNDSGEILACAASTNENERRKSKKFNIRSHGVDREARY